MIHIYIKTHNVTGLKYFGKTSSKNPFKYLGSGKYWLRHLKVHGKDISTEVVASFEDVEEASLYAIEFSKTNNIVESNEWANLMYETVKDGVTGYIHTNETREAASMKSKNMWANPEFKEKMIIKHKERWGDENLNLKERQRQRLLGISRPEHSLKLKGRKFSEERKEKMRVPHRPDHNAAVSASLKGIPKSESHKQNLRKPKPIAVCRLYDKREMSLNGFTNWYRKQLKSFPSTKIDY